MSDETKKSDELKASAEAAGEDHASKSIDKNLSSNPTAAIDSLLADLEGDDRSPKTTDRDPLSHPATQSTGSVAQAQAPKKPPQLGSDGDDRSPKTDRG